jgi:hypothetical protein
MTASEGAALMEHFAESLLELANTEAAPLHTNLIEECATYSPIFLDEKAGSLA